MALTADQRQNMILALLAKDITDVLNQALSMMNAKLILDYTHKDHQARLYLQVAEWEKQLWMVTSRRDKICRIMPLEGPTHNVALLINTGLSGLEAFLRLAAEKPRNKKPIAKLQVHVAGARNFAITLANVIAGKSLIENSFELPMP